MVIAAGDSLLDGPMLAETDGFESIGENANGLAGALFAGAGSGSSPSVTLDFYDRTGLGTFTRAS